MSINVWAPCIEGWVRECDTEFVDISEGPQGEDRLVFICPECDEEHTSNRVGRPDYDE